MTKLVLFLLILATLTPPPPLHAARILSVAFISSKSHKITYDPLLYELAARGHSMAIVTPFISGKNWTYVTEIQTIPRGEDGSGDQSVATYLSGSLVARRS